VEGVRAKDYELSTKIVKSLNSSILKDKMVSIVEKVHLAGTLEDTLLLINFSQELTYISISCAIIQALFGVLKAKNLLKTIHAMHLWSHALSVKGYENFPKINAIDQEKCTSTCTELDKNKEKYFEIYRGFVEDPDEKKIVALHNSNFDFDSILSDFVELYYDGDLEKACVLLSAANNICCHCRIPNVELFVREDGPL
jgi:hypothetical protein